MVEVQKTEEHDGSTAGAPMATDAEAATEAARSLVDGEFLRQIVNLHASVFGNCCDGTISSQALEDAFESAYSQGWLLFSHYIEASGQCLMREVDDITATGEIDSG